MRLFDRLKTIICDTRQQKGKHELKHGMLEQMGYRLLRSKLPFGDYCFPPKAAVDTKRDIAELHYDIQSKHHNVFRDECESARECGSKLYILTENNDGIRSLGNLAAWTEPFYQFKKRKNAAKPIQGQPLANACKSMEDSYGVEFHFCAPEETAGKIVELLERGERGE